MKIAIFLLLLSFNTQAAKIEIIDPCNQEIRYKKNLKVDKINLGSFSLMAFEELGLPYLGDKFSILSILDTPTGSEAIEVLEDNQMKAYGWCYSINGVSPEVYPNEIEVNNSDQVTWWFGYALYQNGQWLTQCTPSYKNPPQFLCQN